MCSLAGASAFITAPVSPSVDFPERHRLPARGALLDTIPRRSLHNAAAAGILPEPFIVLSCLLTASHRLVLCCAPCFVRSWTRSCMSGGGEDTLVLLLLLVLLAIVGVFSLYRDDM